MIYYYNKLVRDKIVENIKNKGHKCEYRTLDNDEYIKELDKKLLEEANEVAESHSAEEIGDLLEVIKAIMKEHNISKEDIEQAMDKKRIKNGAFEDKKYLISVEEN